ncbi:putative F-box protein At1g32420 [Silene latifolia]|uniref:putative F-box protein At1g32420 n=1 Tax=Silene latifolia TaxID=37657 RepID=UPI003D786C76
MGALEDIIYYNILPRLPAKSLLRFKCVSKVWYDLINSSGFINMQHKRTLVSPTSDDTILVVPGVFNVSSYTYFDATQPTNNRKLLPHAPAPAIIVGCCNGLICLRFERGCLGLCDPLNNWGDCRIIPPRIDIITSNSTESHGYGFGYDDVSRVYKIVNIETSYMGYTRASKVYVLSSGIGSWQEVWGVPTHTAAFGASVSTNNKLHWILRCIPDHDHNHGDCYIVTLDLHTEVFGKMSIPSSKENYPWTGCDMIVSSGLLYLHMPNNKDGRVDSIAEIWVMKEYGVADSWTKLHNYAPGAFRYRGWQIWLIDFKLGRVLLANYFHTVRTTVEPFWYNLQDSSTTKVDVPHIRRIREGKPWVCVSSLISTPHLQSFTSFTLGMRECPKEFFHYDVIQARIDDLKL